MYFTANNGYFQSMKYSEISILFWHHTKTRHLIHVIFIGDFNPLNGKTHQVCPIYKQLTHNAAKLILDLQSLFHQTITIIDHAILYNGKMSILYKCTAQCAKCKHRNMTGVFALTTPLFSDNMHSPSKCTASIGRITTPCHTPWNWTKLLLKIR